MAYVRVRVLCSRAAATRRSVRCTQTGIGRSLDFRRGRDGASASASDCPPVGADVCVRTDVRLQTQACACAYEYV